MFLVRRNVAAASSFLAIARSDADLLNWLDNPAKKVPESMRYLAGQGAKDYEITRLSMPLVSIRIDTASEGWGVAHFKLDDSEVKMALLNLV